jgi:hypothetical protein
VLYSVVGQPISRLLGIISISGAYFVLGVIRSAGASRDQERCDGDLNVFAGDEGLVFVCNKCEKTWQVPGGGQRDVLGGARVESGGFRIHSNDAEAALRVAMTGCQGYSTKPVASTRWPSVKTFSGADRAGCKCAPRAMTSRANQRDETLRILCRVGDSVACRAKQSGSSVLKGQL